MLSEQSVSGPVSQAALARMLGVSDTAVRKAIAKGRIRRRADGLIDADEALRDWRRNAAQPRPAPLAEPSASAAAPAPTTPEPQESDAPAPRTGPTIVDLQRASLALKTQRQKLDLEARRGELVERAKVERAVFDFARRMRDAWANWPPRVAAQIAARLGADPHAVEAALAAEVRRHLQELARDPMPRLDADR
ncbi:MAG: hypothetical protein KatS3mg116_2072 [Elioraea sp.]|nr:MAG: hypothetical protein KatS3mg116_2072 [Elioraea sp.]